VQRVLDNANMPALMCQLFFSDEYKNGISLSGAAYAAAFNKNNIFVLQQIIVLGNVGESVL